MRPASLRGLPLRVVEVRGDGDDGLRRPAAPSAASAFFFSWRRMNAEISGGVNVLSPS